MVQVFAKRFWSFDPVGWPVISFGKEGNRDALVRASQPGDLIAFIGTQEPPTADEDRGRLLGLAEIGRQAVDTLDVLDPTALCSVDYDSDGSFKWPKALAMLRAWRFPHRPLVVEVLGRQLTFEATVRAVLLSPEEQAAVLALAMEEIELPTTPALQRLRLAAEALKGPTQGPEPSTWEGSTGQDATLPASTYAFRFGSHDVWKIGHAQDVKTRLAEVNAHLPVEVLRECWTAAYHHKWPTQKDAYEMEQRVLARLAEKRTEGERVSCTEDELSAAWTAAITGSARP